MRGFYAPFLRTELMCFFKREREIRKKLLENRKNGEPSKYVDSDKCPNELYYETMNNIRNYINNRKGKK